MEAGPTVVSVRGDRPAELTAEGSALRATLPNLIRDTFQSRDDGSAPQTLARIRIAEPDAWGRLMWRYDDVRVDLLQVACEYLGYRPSASDVTGPALCARRSLLDR